LGHTEGGKPRTVVRQKPLAVPAGSRFSPKEGDDRREFTAAMIPLQCETRAGWQGLGFRMWCSGFRVRVVGVEV